MICSFLLIWLISANRFYAVCRPSDFKSIFTRNFTHKWCAVILLVAVLQGLINSFYVWVSAAIQKLIDVQFIIMMDVCAGVATVSIVFVYMKVWLNRDNHRSSTHDTLTTITHDHNPSERATARCFLIPS